MTYCPTLAQARKAYPWLNPNGYAVKAIAETDQALTKVSYGQVKATEKAYKAWYEKQNGCEYKDPDSGQREDINLSAIEARFKFENIPDKAYRVILKKMKKDKMIPEILASYVKAGVTYVSGYAV